MTNKICMTSHMIFTPLFKYCANCHLDRLSEMEGQKIRDGRSEYRP